MNIQYIYLVHIIICDALPGTVCNIQDRTAWIQPEQKQQHIKAKAAKAANINITHTPHDAFCTSVLLVEERWMAIHL